MSVQDKFISFTHLLHAPLNVPLGQVTEFDGEVVHLPGSVDQCQPHFQ